MRSTAVTSCTRRPNPRTTRPTRRPGTGTFFPNGYRRTTIPLSSAVTNGTEPRNSIGLEEEESTRRRRFSPKSPSLSRGSNQDRCRATYSWIWTGARKTGPRSWTIYERSWRTLRRNKKLWQSTLARSHSRSSTSTQTQDRNCTLTSTESHSAGRSLRTWVIRRTSSTVQMPPTTSSQSAHASRRTTYTCPSQSLDLSRPLPWYATNWNLRDVLELLVPDFSVDNRYAVSVNTMRKTMSCTLT